MSLAIDPRDFYTSTTQAGYGTWTARRLRCVVEALAGAKVVVVTDRQTGHAITDATLSDVADYGTGMRVTVTYKLSDGNMQSTRYRIAEIGMIIELAALADGGPLAGAKWRALDAWRKLLPCPKCGALLAEGEHSFICPNRK